MTYEATAEDRELIIGTMQNWLAGEPVWTHAQILDRWGQEFLMYRLASEDGYGLDNARRRYSLSALRLDWIKQFGFAIPSSELLDTLAKHQPIVEVGAGTGYLTLLMRNHGIDVIGSDPGPGNREEWFKDSSFDNQRLTLQAKTAVRRYPDRTVFCSWPTLNHTWFRQMLRAMRIGQRLIYIEEDATADETAAEYLEASFDREEWIPIPAWPMLNDRAGVWVKKRHAATWRQPK